MITLISGVRRITSWDKYSNHIQQGQSAYVGLEITEDLTELLLRVGFTQDLAAGQSICPEPQMGRVSRFNANGREVPQRDLPKESYFREVYREWKDWHGNTHSGYFDTEFKRYPRKLIPPPFEYLTIIEKGDKKYVVVGDLIIQGETKESIIKHKVNLLLELFKRADILKDDMSAFVTPRLVKVDWDILPVGEWPWEQSKNRIKSRFSGAPKGKAMILEKRLEIISQYNPSFVAVGIHGYKGYLVFAFPQYNLYMLESPFYGNATYVFEGDWELLSQCTKGQILAGNLHKNRIVHRTNWADEIQNIMNDVSSN